jgi:hypothetical protein
MPMLTTRPLLLAGLLCAACVVAAGPMRADTWCLRSFGTEFAVCAFPSAWDCTRAAAIGAGGSCERKAFAPPPRPDKRRTERKRDNRPGEWWW